MGYCSLPQILLVHVIAETTKWQTPLVMEVITLKKKALVVSIIF